MMRQSSHIWMRRTARSFWNMLCFIARRSSTRSTELLVPNGLPQLMQAKGGSSLSTTALAAAGAKLNRGTRVMTFSGQVALHSPHWTQASSWKRSCGSSGLSWSAPVGQAPTQARQKVQPARSSATAPKGAPVASGTISCAAAAAVARDGVDHFGAGARVVHEKRRPPSAGAVIGAQQRAQPLAERARCRQRVGCGAGRADTVAGAATTAEIGVDRHGVAIGADRRGGADIEAARAAGLARARMRAQRGGEIDIARLLELADEIDEVEERPLHRGRIVRIRPQIAVAARGRGEEGGAAAQIENEIAARAGAVARRLEGQRAAGGGHRRRIIDARELQGGDE